MPESLATLRDQGIYVGTSSWKYPGWKGIVYRRGYPSEKAFQEECLEEYAETYTTVGVDHTYYAWPLAGTFAKYSAQTPDTFRFGLKVTEEVTVFKYPKLARYGKRAGTDNPHFLDAAYFRDHFLPPLDPIRSKLGPLMLEFSQFYPGTLASGGEFVDRLEKFFRELALPEDIQLAVEIRNKNWIDPRYFEALSRHRVAHVFNSWTRVPPVLEQLKIAGETALPSFVARLLLQPGTKYEEAVEAFSPYDAIQDPQPDLRAAGAELIRTALKRKVNAYLFVNNRAEGCAPLTIEGILSLI